VSYQSFPYVGLGRGLNLRDKPDAVDQQECIDAMNVDFTERGAVPTRGGFSQVASSPIRGLASFQTTGGVKRLLTIVGSDLVAYSTAGSAIATTALTASTVALGSARVGTPGNEYIYLANGTDVRRFNGTTFSAPANMPKGQCLCVQPSDNRLISAGFLGSADGPSGATSSPSHVYFSDPGQPETWGANNFVQLTPGDGEKIVGVIAWQGLTFVFKQTKFFVFYGNSVDAGGDPIFNYRAVESEAGLASRFGLTKNESGVYFVDRGGIYRTTGGAPQRVSDIVSPLWTGQASSFYKGGTISDVSACSLTSFQRRLYMAFPSSGGQRVLVHDPSFGWFSLYDLPAKWVHAFDDALWFGDTALNRHTRTIAGDNGEPVNARWRSGWTDFGNPDVKVLRATKLWGGGTVLISRSTDFEDDPGIEELTAFTVTEQPQWNTEEWDTSKWAEAQALTPKRISQAVRGTTFSTLIRGEAPWAVHRLDHLVRQVRQPGIEDS
jgi:hypothetical protein